MAFENGAVNTTIFELPEALPEDLVERFAARCAGSVEQVGSDQRWGWVSGRHLFDTEITEESLQRGSFYYLQLRGAQRKYPSALLNAKCRQAEFNYLKANQLEYVSSKIRRSLKEEIIERELMDMPVTLSSIPVVLAPQERAAFVGAKSETQINLISEWLQKAIGFEPYQLTPNLILEQEFNCTAAACPQVHFAAGFEDEPNIGRDFFTWLWYCSEKDSFLKMHDYEFDIKVEGPMTFAREADNGGAADVVVKKGECPSQSAEAKAALLVGKKLKKAKVNLTRGNNVWSFTFDADSFSASALKLPETESQDAEARFEERIEFLLDFKTALHGYFKKFGDAILNPGFSEYQNMLQNWVTERSGR